MRRELEQLGRSQCGVLTTAQALAYMTRGELRAQLAARRWQRVHRGVLVVHSGPLTWDQRLWASLLAVPTGSALAGPTAAQLSGLAGFEDDRAWVVVPGNHRRAAHTGMVVVQSRVLGPPDVHPTRQPRRTSTERSVLDMSTYAPSERAVRAPLLAAVQQGLTMPDRLRDALGRRGRCRHRALIAETITDAEGGVESLPEREFDQIRRRCGLPSPTRGQLGR